MKRLLLAVLVSSLFLSGACATDKAYLTENEVCAYIWTYQLNYHLPQVGPGQISYDKSDFYPNSSTAEYLGNGVWAYVIEGSHSKTNSVETPLMQHKDGWGAIYVLRQTLSYNEYSDAALNRVGSISPSKVSAFYIKDSLTTVYDVKFTANYYEKVRTLDNLAIRSIASKTEAKQFLLWNGESLKLK